MTAEEMESVTYAIGLLGLFCIYKVVRPPKIKKDADVIDIKRKALNAANRWPR